MAFGSREIAGLMCRSYDELPAGQEPKVVVVLCHGFGAAGDDLVGLGPEFLRQQPELASAVRFIFPEAPLSLEELGMPGGRAWWHLDLEKLNAAVEQGGIRDLRNDHPEELPAASEKMIQLVANICTETGLPTSQVVLGGFSQGAMLTTDVMLRLPEPPGLLCVLSGSLVSEDEWRTLAKQRGNVSVFQSHGDQDPILPYCAAEWLRDLLTESEMDVEFLPFSGMHTIPLAAVERIAARLVEMCSKE